MHVHVIKGEGIGKVWLEPKIAPAYFRGFRARDEKFVLNTIVSNESRFKAKWHEHFQQ